MLTLQYKDNLKTKKNGFILLYGLLLLLSGCTSEVDSITPSQSPIQQSYIADSIVPLSNETIIFAESEVSETDTFVDNMRTQYAELYDATHIFTDMYMTEKAWLIGEVYIVQIISIAEFNDVSVITRDSIERIENSSFGDSASVKVFDKTGESISLMIKLDELLIITDLLK